MEEGALKRIVIVAATVVALGVGVTVASTREGSGPAPATQAAPSQGRQTWDQRLCDKAAKQLRAKHPNAYIGGCNHGASTLPTP